MRPSPSAAVNNAANHMEATAAVKAINGVAGFNVSHTATPEIIG